MMFQINLSTSHQVGENLKFNEFFKLVYLAFNLVYLLPFYVCTYNAYLPTYT